MSNISTPSTQLTQYVVSDQSFGGNYLFNRANSYENIGQTGAYDELARALGVTHLRYPGGAISESLFHLSDPTNFDITNTDGALGFAKAAAEIGAKITIVLPSSQYVSAILSGNPAAKAAAISEVAGFVEKIMQSAYAGAIEGFEIGNEYYGTVANIFGAALPGVSAAKAYGMVANEMAAAVKGSINHCAAANSPAVIVQAGKTPADNGEVMSAFSAASISNVDGVSAHNYRPTPWLSQSETMLKFSILDSWQSRSGSKHLLRVISEWNVGSQGVQGLQAGAGLLDMFSLQLRNGVDRQHVWPLLQNTSNVLGFNVDPNYPNIAPRSTIEGKVFGVASHSLRGLSPFDFDSRFDPDSDGQPNALIHAYSDGLTKLVLSISSLENHAESFTVDLGSLGMLSKSYTHLWGQEIGVVAGSDPTSSLSKPTLQTLTSIQLEGTKSGDGKFTFSLQPYETLFLNFSSGQGVVIKGDNESLQNDYLIGSPHGDSLAGGLGDDTLRGGSGSDVYHWSKGDGNDTIVEGSSSMFDLDRLVLTDVATTDTFLSRPDGSCDLMIEILTASGISKIIIKDQFAFGLSNPGIEQIQFNSGPAINLNSILNNTAELKVAVESYFQSTTWWAISGILYGSFASDTLFGNSNDDSIFANAGDDVVFGGYGNDTIDGGLGNDSLFGDDGKDLVFGGVGNDAIDGNVGDDRLFGDSGDDKLIGGGGNDILTGGIGADQFIFNSTASGVDTITDFNQLDGGARESDVLSFRGLLVGGFSYVGSGAFTGGSDNSEARVSGSQVLVDTNGDGVADITINLTGLTGASQLTASDFLWT